jgi:hypothetical protein
VAVKVAISEGLPVSGKNVAAMGIRLPFLKVLSIFYNFLLFPLFSRPNGHMTGSSSASSASLSVGITFLV